MPKMSDSPNVIPIPLLKTPVSKSEDNSDRSAISHHTLCDSSDLSTYTTPTLRKESLFRWREFRRTSQQIYNPFEVRAEIFTKETVSPSLFKEVESPPEGEGTFSWGIDQMAALAPADIENSPYAQYEIPVDPEYERAAQDAIDQFFSRGQPVVPSPWTDTTPRPEHLVARDLLLSSTKKSAHNPCDQETPTMARKNPSTNSRSVSCQTELSLPMDLPPELEALLQQYKQVESPEKSRPRRSLSPHSTSLRRKLNFNDSQSSMIDDEALFLSAQQFQEPEAAVMSSTTDIPQCNDFHWDTNVVSAPPLTPTRHSDVPFWSHDISPICIERGKRMPDLSPIKCEKDVSMKAEENTPLDLQSPCASSPFRSNRQTKGFFNDMDEEMVSQDGFATTVSPTNIHSNKNHCLQWNSTEAHVLNFMSQDQSMEQSQDTGYQTISKSNCGVDFRAESPSNRMQTSMMVDENSLMS